MSQSVDQYGTAPFRILLFMALGCAGFVCPGCQGDEKEESPKGNRTISLGADDSRINHAARKARKTVDQFIEALTHPKSNQNQFGIKVSLHEGDADDHEDLWLDQITFEDDLFHGSLVEEPKLLTSYKSGQRIVVDPEDITDWVYFEDDQMVGGYTELLLERIEWIQSP